MEEQFLVGDGVCEGAVLNSSVDGKDVLNRQWGRDGTMVGLVGVGSERASKYMYELVLLVLAA